MHDMSTLVDTQKCVLITGASSGIGYATAELYLKKNWRVYGLSRSGRVPQGAMPLIADLTEVQALEKAVEEVWLSEGRLDVVVHSAGIGGTGPVEGFPQEEAEKVMNTNFFGTYNVVQACLPYLRKQHSTSLVFISSIAGLVSVPYHGIYSASKFAVEGLVEALRLELWGSGVNVVSVCPGDTNTPIIGNQYRTAVADTPAFYQRNYEKADASMHQSVATGTQPTAIAEAIYYTANKKHPRVRYAVGSWLQKISPKVKKFLPSRLFERMLKNYYGLN